jgi:hypothetical protein
MGRSFRTGRRKSQYLKTHCDTHEHHHPNAFVVDFFLFFFFFYYYYYYYYPVPNLGKHSRNHQAQTFLMSFWQGGRWKKRQGMSVTKTP